MQLDMKTIQDQMDEFGEVRGTVSVPLLVIISNDAMQFFSYLSKELTGSKNLYNMTYKPTGIGENDNIIFYVTGDATDVLYEDSVAKGLD